MFNAADVNGSGFVAPLSPITLTIIDTVVPTGVGQLNTPQTIVFQNVHVGTAESQSLNVSNTGAAPISVALSAANPIIVQGSIASLAAGVTDTTDLSVGVDTSNAGAQSGIVNVNFGATAPQIDVFGDVFRLASGTVAPVTAFLHVGDTGTIALDIPTRRPRMGSPRICWERLLRSPAIWASPQVDRPEKSLLGAATRRPCCWTSPPARAARSAAPRRSI